MNYIALIENCKAPKDLHELLVKIEVHCGTLSGNIAEWGRATFYKKTVENQIRHLESKGVFLNQVGQENETRELLELREKIVKIRTEIGEDTDNPLYYEIVRIIEAKIV